MSDLNVPKGEQGATRVFALSLSPQEARALRDDAQKAAAALGIPALNSAGVEVFALSDLGDLGLAGYLREGVDAQESDLRRDAAKLAALDGWVMLVHSSAFAGEAHTLQPTASVTHIGTYTQTPADNTAAPIASDAAQPYSGTPAPSPEQRPAVRARGSMVVVVVLVLVALALWWALG